MNFFKVLSLLLISVQAISQNCQPTNLDCATAQTLSTNLNFGDLVCAQGCNANIISPNGEGPCGSNTVWYYLRTSSDVNQISLEVDGIGAVVAIRQSDCNTGFSDCTSLGTGVAFAVNVETDYYLGIQSLDVGDFELCISGELQQATCSTGTLTAERPENPGAQPEGPYLPGELVRFTYNIEFAVDSAGMGNNCQWLQGLIPSFGAGWNLQAVTPASQGPGGWQWLPEGSVDYNVMSNTLMLQPSPHGGTELATGSGGLIAGNLLPSGWWFTSPGVGASCSNDGDPDNMWGLPAACGDTVVVNFTFELQVTDNIDPIANAEDDYLKVEIFSMADGQTGCWANNTCGGDAPTSFFASAVTFDTNLVNLRPDIGQGDCNVAFELTVEECQQISPFCFPDPTMWVNNPATSIPECSWPFFPQEDVVFAGGCPPYTYIFSPDNPIPEPGNITITGIGNGMDAVFECINLPYSGTVEWTVVDACGGMLEWSFDIDVQCINCPPLACVEENITVAPCLNCEDANGDINPDSPCFICDATVLNGFCSCTIPGNPEIDTSQFNANSLCNDGFVANNISWFSFTAGSPNIDIDITEILCTSTTSGAIGIQLGIFAGCNLGECLSADNNCGGLQDKFVSLTDITVGEIYYIYVDGCAGAGCSFLIEVFDQEQFLLDQPRAVIVDTPDASLGNPCTNNQTITTCIGEELSIRVTHDDTSPTETPPPFDGDCATYDPDLDADYIWSITPAINDTNLGNIGGANNLLIYNTKDDGIQLPALTPSEAGSFEVCLESVVTRCDTTTNRACATLVIEDCSFVDNDGDGSPAGQDCDDNDPNNFPGNTEICDGQDNNCNLTVDEGFPLHTAPILSCAAIGNNSLTVSWDINATADIYQVYLNGNFINSTSDNTSEITGLTPGTEYEIRVDILFNNSCTRLTSMILCTTDNFVDNDGDGSPVGQDCDDNDPNNFPGNTEICDGQDNNCNNEIDEDLEVMEFYADIDGDGFGDPLTLMQDCIQLAGSVSNGDDCDDSNPTINPDAMEIPGNGIDEDCDGDDTPSATYEIGGTVVDIYPNPVTEKLQIQTTLQDLDYKLYSISGRLLTSGQVLSKEINVSDYPTGIYLLYLEHKPSKVVITEKIIKL